MSRESLSRLKKEYEAIQKDPIPNAIACPDPKNWLRWHYIIYGLDGPFSGGVYYGELRFPAHYPMGPPSILMHTPNGRFISGKKICTSMSDFHPETWSPIWKVSTIITGLISFMQDNENSTGCEVTTAFHKMTMAKKSMEWNNNNSTFKDIFEDYKEIFTPKGQNEPVEAVRTSKTPSLAPLAAIILVLIIAVLFKYR
ncbi:hypothetical protein SteCoe_13302 [Stentor coeruleus]|uniref:UBC core domain-containing protein n=1 Tax=Stentor coeruleus TaxID=5963 RepID=A0A1R2C8R2_9CILI|nr:hypothetical protein SteCoe_15014 [Stentor coeruleus]OMJ85392.1 hypothetical protein SteCoe_13302 [Stentor coeruleus]